MSSMTYYTWNGLDLFQKVETAATHALDYNRDPQKLLVLIDGGQTRPAEDWEVADLVMHMRDQAPPC